MIPERKGICPPPFGGGGGGGSGRGGGGGGGKQKAKKPNKPFKSKIDPYHDVNQANGLCFSVRDGIPFPPSLLNIFKEIQDDLGTPIPTSGDLSRWAHQGVLLLNSTLTVRAHSAGSHQNKGWEQFTDEVILQLAQRKENLVFILWGAYAIKKGAFINRMKHLVLTSPHPSPLSAYRGFFGCKHFSQANKYLTEHGKAPIEW